MKLLSQLTDTSIKHNIDVELLDGMNSASTATPSTIVARDGSGHILGVGFNTTMAVTSTAASHYFVETGSDNWIRPKTLANVKAEIVTKPAIESVLTGVISTHTHVYDNYEYFTIGDGVNSNNITTKQTVNLIGAGATSVSYNIATNTFTIQDNQSASQVSTDAVGSIPASNVQTVLSTLNSNIVNHASSTSNPHQVTSAQVGAIPLTFGSSKGALITYSAPGTPVVLPSGSANQVLITDSAGALEWTSMNAASYTLPVATTTLLGGVKDSGSNISIASDGNVTLDADISVTSVVASASVTVGDHKMEKYAAGITIFRYIGA